MIIVKFLHASYSEGPSTQNGDRSLGNCWPVKNRSHLSMVSQKLWKRRFCVRSFVLVDLSVISPLRWTNLAFIERSLRDHWEIYETIERSLSAPWAFIDCFLCIHWEIASLCSRWEIVLDWVKTVRRPWWPRRSLEDNCSISERSLSDLGDRWVITGTALWKMIEISSDF